MIYIIILLFLPLASCYHSTDSILRIIQTECTMVKELSCDMQGDILVVDWKKHQPRGVVWAFNEHAREKITAELALEMIQELKHIRPDTRVTIVPIVNAWGRRQVESGKHCQRKNKNGVDTNRNYPQKMIHHYAKLSEEYEGKHALSEPETRLVSRLLRGASRYVNVHSGEYSLYMPWDSLVSRPPHYDEMKKKLQEFRQHCKQCAVGPAAITSFYKAFGSSVDYAITIGVPEAYTFEIFGSNSPNCDRMFNPYGLEKRMVLDQWKKIMTMTVT